MTTDNSILLKNIHNALVEVDGVAALRITNGSALTPASPSPTLLKNLHNALVDVNGTVALRVVGSSDSGPSSTNTVVALSGMTATIPIPITLAQVRGVSVRKNTGEVVSVEVIVGQTEIVINSHVDLQDHTAYIS